MNKKTDTTAKVKVRLKKVASCEDCIMLGHLGNQNPPVRACALRADLPPPDLHPTASCRERMGKDIEILKVYLNIFGIDPQGIQLTIQYDEELEEKEEDTTTQCGG